MSPEGTDCHLRRAVEETHEKVLVGGAARASVDGGKPHQAAAGSGSAV